MSVTIFVCDPSPEYSSFEEQWGAQLGASQMPVPGPGRKQSR